MEYCYYTKYGYLRCKDDGSKILYPTDEEFFEAKEEEKDIREKNKD